MCFSLNLVLTVVSNSCITVWTLMALVHSWALFLDTNTVWAMTAYNVSNVELIHTFLSQPLMGMQLNCNYKPEWAPTLDG